MRRGGVFVLGRKLPAFPLQSAQNLCRLAEFDTIGLNDRYGWTTIGIFPLKVVATMHRILVAGLLTILTAGATTAQAQVAAARVAAARVAAAQAAPDPLEDPYVRELVRRSRGDNLMLATSISDALTIKLDEFASGFLVSLAGRKLDDSSLAEVTRRISQEQLLRVTIEPQFSEPAKAQATAMLNALRNFEQSSDRILPAIAKLAIDSPDQRLAALRTVLAGGDASISLLSVAVAQQTDTVTRDELLRVMLRLGDGGAASLRQLAIYGNDSIRAGALEGLIRLGGNQVKPVVVAATHDPNSTNEERAIAENWLKRRYSALPSHNDAEQFLVGRLANEREAMELVTDHEATIPLWTIGEDLESVKHTTVTAIDAARRAVIDHVRLLHRLGTLSSAARDAGIAADLSYRYELDPLGIREVRAELAGLWGEESVSASGLVRLIETAIQRSDFSSAVATMQLIDESMAGDADYFVSTHSEIRTPLVVAASHSIPRLRYEAAAAIARLGYELPYAGSSDVLNRWLEMTGLSREPIVILVETRNEVFGQIERFLISMGYRVEVVSSVRDAVFAIDRGGDLRFMISTTVLPDRSSMELVDAVRRRPLGADLPIILHGPMDDVVEAVTSDFRSAIPVVHVELPSSAAGWSLILEPLESERSLPSLAAVERFDFRVDGAVALGRIASQPDVFSFYEFDKLAGAGISKDMQISKGILGDDSATVAFGEPLLAVLSVAASRDAQSALVDLAILAGATEKQREAASEALLSSIERDGVLLERGDLLRLGETRRSMDDQLGASIDRVIVEIGRRADLTGAESGFPAEIDASKQTEERVSPPDN